MSLAKSACAICLGIPALRFHSQAPLPSCICLHASHCDAGINGAGKTTQLQIITGSIQPDGGEILKQKANMKIAYLTQEFDVETTRTVRVGTILLIERLAHVHYHLIHAQQRRRLRSFGARQQSSWEATPS